MTPRSSCPHCLGTGRVTYQSDSGTWRPTPGDRDECQECDVPCVGCGADEQHEACAGCGRCAVDEATELVVSVTDQERYLSL